MKFLTSAGKKGIALMTGGLLAFVLTLVEHVRGSSVPALTFMIVSFCAFAGGSYLAWSDVDRKYEAEKLRISKPQITGEIIRADFGFMGSYTEQGRTTEMTCLMLKLRITNRTNSAATLKGASLLVERDGNRYEAERELLPEGPYASFGTGGGSPEKIVDLLKTVTYNAPVRFGIASVGWLQFCVRGLEHSKGNIKADLTVALVDEFGERHLIVAKDQLIVR